jgi:hypothetical protein
MKNEEQCEGWIRHPLNQCRTTQEVSAQSTRKGASHENQNEREGRPA